MSKIADAVEAIAGSRHIYCLGHRSCYAPAYHFAYVAGLYGLSTRLLDAPGGIGADPLNEIGEGDLLLAVASAPYSRATVDHAAVARAQGATILAITDSDASPIARIAEHVVAVPNEMAGATSAATPILAAVEVLAALVVARSGLNGRRTLERNEAGFAHRRVYWDVVAEMST